jgi:hypothetical protein
MRRSILTAAALGLAAMTSLAAQEARPPVRDHDGMMGMMMPEQMHQQMDGMMGGMSAMMGIHAYDPASLLDSKSDLALSKDQIAKLDGLAAEVKIAMDHARTEMGTRHARISEQFKQANPDPAKVKADGQEAMQDMAAACGVELSAAARAKAVLTDAQRAKVDSWITGHEKMMHGTPGGSPMHPMQRN